MESYKYLGSADGAPSAGRLLFAAALLALASLGSCGRVDKCCGPGDVLVLSGSGELECASPAAAQPQELLELRGPEAEASRGLPRCDQSSHLALQQLSAQPEEPGEPGGRRLPRDACLDLFHDAESRQDFSVLIFCKPLAGQAGPKVGSPRHSTAPLLSFRKCCPGDSYYDADSKFCTEGRADLKLLFERLGGLDFLDLHAGPPECEHVLVDYRVPLEEVHYEDAALRVAIPRADGSGRRENVTVGPENACLDAEASSDFVVARLCRGAEYCDANPCVRKCCSETAVDSLCLDAMLRNVDVKKFRVSLALAAASSNLTPAFDARNYGLLTGKPCPLLYWDDTDVWEIGASGDVVVQGGQKTVSLNHTNSCLEYIFNNSLLPDGLHASFCFEDDELVYVAPARPAYNRLITVVLSLISCFFLFAMLLVYACLPSLQNLHGKTIMCYAASLCCAYASLAIVTMTTEKLLDSLNADTADLTCVYLGYAMMFFFHSSFLWLNVMCFDIWWTFGGLRMATSIAAKRVQQRKRFLCYCGYAWGLGLLLSSLAVVSDMIGLFGSYFGRVRCWFDETSASEVVFFISPVSVTLLVNTVFFVVTVRRCSKVKAEIKRVMANVKDPTTRKFHSDKTRLIMNLKLFVVMGIPWLLDNLTSYLVHYYLMPVWVQEVTFVADVVNSLQGLWIFVLFVMKPKVYHALRRRFRTEKLRDKDSNNLTVATCRNMRTCSSTSTLTSNFVLSS